VSVTYSSNPARMSGWDKDENDIEEIQKKPPILPVKYPILGL
jgi:hypothetical protein